MTNDFLNYFKMLKEDANDAKIFIKDNDFVRMMHELKRSIDLIIELEFLNDYNEMILNSITKDRTENVILNLNNIKDILNENDVIEIVNFLSQNGFCIIIEPNNNIYIDIDYTLIKNTFSNSISRNAVYSIVIHEKVQNFAFVDNKGNLSKDINDFKKEILADCDFQKNEIMFSYCCEALDFISLSITVYKK